MKKNIPTQIFLLCQTIRSPKAFLCTDHYLSSLSQSGIVWRMKMNGEVVPGTHRYINDKYRGIPTEIDAAVRWDSRTIYFFKDSKWVCFANIYICKCFFFNMTLSTKITYNFAHEYIARFHYFSMLINTISSSEYIWVIALLLHFLQM